MSTLTKVIPSTTGRCLDIELGDVCNYACSYCHPVLYSGSTWLDYNTLVSFINQIDAPYVILGGGEPVLYPKISELLQELQGRTVTVLTNASNELSWWQANLQYIDYPILAYHNEFADYESFEAICEYVAANNPNAKVNVCAIPFNFDECVDVANQLRNIPNLTVLLKPLKSRSLQNIYEYTQEQLEILDNNLEDVDQMLCPMCEYSDKGPSKVTPQELLLTGDNVYTGWACWKGIDLLKIKPNGNIYKATCDTVNDDYICTIDNPIDFSALQPVSCDKDFCTSLSDLRTIRKEKN